MDGNTQPKRITEEPLTLEEEYEIVRYASLTEAQQHMYLLHLQDQFEAIPSYAERFAGKLTSSSPEESTQ